MARSMTSRFEKIFGSAASQKPLFDRFELLAEYSKNRATVQACLFTNAEPAEDLSQNFFDVYSTRDLSQRQNSISELLSSVYQVVNTELCGRREGSAFELSREGIS